jgi:hypothetical protein
MVKYTINDACRSFVVALNFYFDATNKVVGKKPVIHDE